MGKRIVEMALAAVIACSLHASAAPVWKKGAAIPVATEGSVCNSVTDKIAVTSANQILSCQSGGVWGAAQGSGKTGLVGLLYPVRGKSISCVIGSDPNKRGSASVDANGNVTLGVYFNPIWTYQTNVSSVATSYVRTDLLGGGILVTDIQFGPAGQCSASWPAT